MMGFCITGCLVSFLFLSDFGYIAYCTAFGRDDAADDDEDSTGKDDGAGDDDAVGFSNAVRGDDVVNDDDAGEC